MSIINCNIKDYVLLCGDIHGKYDIIPDFLKKYDITNAAIIQLGDFGIGWEIKEKELRALEYFSKRLAVSNSHVFSFRGNHDDPDWFKEYFSNGYIHLIPDYSVLNINNLNILCIGGAVSVDRSNRKDWLKMKGIKWWLDKQGRKKLDKVWFTDEVIKYDLIVETITGIDIVASHTAPYFAYPQTKGGVGNFINRDDELLADLTEERQLMGRIYDELSKNNDIKKWYYGHYHNSNKELYKGTEFHLLDVDEIIEHI